jgi:hypothetical protein
MAPTEILEVLDSSGTSRFASTKSEFERNWTLGATIDWSFQLLAEPECRVFRRLALFVGTFNLAAARSVCSEIDHLGVAESIDALVDRSLVVAEHDADGTRFRLLEPIRQSALGRLAEVGEVDDVRRRHADWSSDLVDGLAPMTMGHEQASAFRRIHADYSNIRLAFETLVECDEPDGYLDLAFGLYWFWTHESLHLDGHERCLRGLDLAVGPIYGVRLGLRWWAPIAGPGLGGPQHLTSPTDSRRWRQNSRRIRPCETRPRQPPRARRLDARPWNSRQFPGLGFRRRPQTAEEPHFCKERSPHNLHEVTRRSRPTCGLSDLVPSAHPRQGSVASHRHLPLTFTRQRPGAMSAGSVRLGNLI